MGDFCSTRVLRVFGTPDERLGVFGEIAARGARSGRVVRLARSLAASSASRLDLARAIQLVAQSLPYVPDGPGAADDVREPCRVLDVGGDCEDLAILVASLDLAAGIRPRLSWLEQPKSDADHVSVEAWVDGRWLWQEPTVAAYLGENPYVAAGRLGGHSL